jgi:hypothetical protein
MRLGLMLWKRKHSKALEEKLDYIAKHESREDHNFQRLLFSWCGGESL